METRQEKLRMWFKAETDIEYSEENIPLYAEWLEKVRVNSLNGDLMIENINLKITLQKAIDILDDGMTKRCTKI